MFTLNLRSAQRDFIATLWPLVGTDVGGLRKIYLHIFSQFQILSIRDTTGLLYRLKNRIEISFFACTHIAYAVI